MAIADLAYSQAKTNNEKSCSVTASLFQVRSPNLIPHHGCTSCECSDFSVDIKVSDGRWTSGNVGKIRGEVVKEDNHP